MASESSICSQALAHIGQGPIVNLDDSERRARTCKLLYADKRDALLRSYRWKFAIARVADVSPQASDPAFGYSHRYIPPNDCLRVLSVNELDPEYDPDLDPALWDREGDSVVTDLGPTVNLRYVRRVEDPNRFDYNFIDALAIFMAQYLAPTFDRLEPQLRTSLREEFELVVARARQTSAIEGRPRLRRYTRSSWTHGYRQPW